MSRCGVFAARVLSVCACALLVTPSALATGVPIGGFLPLLGIGLTDKFRDGNDPNIFYVQPESSYSGAPLGPGSSAHFDLALLDTGASVSVLTTPSTVAFDIEGEGFEGNQSISITGATGFIDATVQNPLGLFLTGLNPSTVLNSGPLQLSTANMKGISNSSVVTVPIESDLPNVVGLPYATQFATYIRNDQPQVLTINGNTVRTPNIVVLPLGSGAQGTMSRAQFTFKPGAAFQQPPFYFPSFTGEEWNENPQHPTNVSGGMFLNVGIQNTTPANGFQTLSAQFLFDTGADVTVMSEVNASALGFDVLNDEPEFTVAVVGSGGTIEDVPGFFADQLTLPAVGGNLVAMNVPIIVLDVPDVSDPVNVLPGIIGTNIFVGRNLVIDPITAIGGGSPGLWFSAPVTTAKNWTTSAASGTFGTDSNWSGGAAPTLDNRGIANVRWVSGGNQTAVVSANATVWELNVSGTATQTMTVAVQSGVKLTTFSGINIETGGVVSLQNGALDAQFVEIVGGTLRGQGTIVTGSGPIPGQVENRSGTVSPGDEIGELEITGRFANGHDGTIAMQLGGDALGQYDQVLVDGPVALAGILSVSLVNSFAPSVDDSFVLLDLVGASGEIGGEFENLLLPSGYEWDVEYTDDQVVLTVLSVILDGDFNKDGVVDGADYVMWRKTNISGFENYTLWTRNFGNTLPGGGGGLGGVPEPSAMAIVLLASCGLAIRRKRSQR
jgi:hypothetical protein